MYNGKYQCHVAAHTTYQLLSSCSTRARQNRRAGLMDLKKTGIRAISLYLLLMHTGPEVLTQLTVKTNMVQLITGQCEAEKHQMPH